MDVSSYVNRNINNWSTGLRGLSQNPLAGYTPVNSTSMDPTGIISAGANLVGGIFNYASQKRAQDLQWKMFKAGYDQSEFWNAKNYENANYWKNFDYWYNTPDQQVRRLKEAGLNPALMLGQISPGMTSSQSAGQGTQSSPGVANIQPNTAIGDAIQNIPQSLMMREQIAYQREKTKEQSIENMYRAAHLLADLQGKKYKNQNQFDANRIQQLDLEIKGDTKEVVKQMMRQNLSEVTSRTHQLQAETTGIIIDNTLKPFFAGLSAKQLEVDQKNAETAKQSMENEFKLGLARVANERALTTAQVELLGKQSEIAEQEGLKLKYANNNFAVFHSKGGKTMRVPIAFMADVSQFLEKNANRRLTEKDIDNYLRKLDLKQQEIDANSAKAWITAIASGVGIFLGTKISGVKGSLSSARKGFQNRYNQLRSKSKTTPPPPFN